MKIVIHSWLVLGVFLFAQLLFTSSPVVAETVLNEEENQSTITPLYGVSNADALMHSGEGIDSHGTPGMVYMFGRDDCGFCQKQKVFMDEAGIVYTYLNIKDDPNARAQYNAVIEKHGLSKVTPITVVGERVFLGFNGPHTTGKDIQDAIKVARLGSVNTVSEHLMVAPVQSVAFGGGCSEIGCTEVTDAFVFALPFFGVVDLKTFSLFSLSLILGVIDGFNPCAMWVLITFLALLAQAGSKRRMVFLAGLFIVAEGVMYNLILNVWYKTWDFVKLDEIVTPLVGLIALGGGAFFLYRWFKNRQVALTCDISSVDDQMKTVNRFKQIVQQPITITSIIAILVIAFSVNVIEFACSIGIPQAYTKILELNMLTFIERQWYLFVFTLGYMIDDVIVFGLAIWGFSRLEAHGQKYAQHSLLIGGVLMLLLGLLLFFNPQLLVL